MSKPLRHEASKEVPKGHDSPPDDALTELRGLLLRPEQTQLSELQDRLNDPRVRAADVSQILPEAVILRSSRDERLASALEPTITKAIRTSIKKDREIFSDILFPIIGPAIRKAVSSAIRGMVQSLNQVLEHSLSIQGLRWRLEALRTKRPFGEVVLLHTLIYQIEQVFLIHRSTGLMLQHVVAEEVVSQDPDLVSSMLTAIQDFVQDSLDVEKGEGLDSLQIGDRSVWIDQGPHALLAAVIRGNPPENLKLTLSKTLEDIHIDQGEDLESFAGDITPFEAVRYRLEDCIQVQFRQKRRRTPSLLWLLLAALIFSVGLWTFSLFLDHRRWTRYLERLDATPGIVVTDTGKSSGKRYIFGLRDPLAPDPVDMLRLAELEHDSVRFRWEPYYSVDPEIMVRRIVGILNPPETVNFVLRSGILYAVGEAPYQWVSETRKLMKAVPGFVQYRDDGVAVIEQSDMEMIAERINRRYLLFGTRESAIRSDHVDILHELAEDIEELLRLAQILSKNVRIEITGHTDSSGSREANLKFSQERADNVLAALVSKGLEKRNFVAVGVGSEQPLREETTKTDGESNRCVTFRVVLSDSPG